MTTITIPRTLLEQALEALEQSRVFVTTREKIKHPEGTDWYDEHIADIRAELAKQKLDPTGSELPNKQANQQDLTSQGQVPAWHDAPTCDGLWVCNEGEDSPYRWTTHCVKFPISPLLVGEGERWYGPIPEDKEGEKS